MLYQQQRELRNQVLMRPIGMPDHAWEMKDADSFHFVALKDGQVIGCLLLYQLPDKPNVVQLMQMATAQECQGQGIGRGLVMHAVEFCKKENVKEIICHARDDALGFYEKMGFEIYDEPFEEVGIPHYHMRFDSAFQQQANV